MDIEQHYLDLYKVMHQDKKTYQGISLQKEIPNIANLVLVTNSETVLDYGCGKGNQYIQSHSNITAVSYTHLTLPTTVRV